MSRALWFLLGLHIHSYLRFFTRSLRTVKGLLLTFVGLFVFGFWLWAVLFGGSASQPLHPETLRTNGPAFLLLYCLLQVLFSASENSIYFAPAEVQFLFTGPFSRREILVYKIVLMTVLTLPVPLVFSLLVMQHAGSWLGAVLAMVLGIVFLNLFTLATNLLVDLLGAAAYSKTRRVALLLLLAGGVALLAFNGGLPTWTRVGGQAASLAQTPFVRAITWPLTWFFELFLARDAGSFLTALGMAVLVDFGLLLVVFALDRNFLEVSAGNSARIYTRLQQMRRGQSALSIGGGTSRWSLPDFPFWGGIGPTFWRQLTQAARGMGRLVVILLLIAGGIGITLANIHTERAPHDVPPWPSLPSPPAHLVLASGCAGAMAPAAPLGASLDLTVAAALAELPQPAGPLPSEPDDPTSGKLGALLGVSAGMIVWLTIFLTALVPFDFRGDIDRLAHLKTLPVPLWALAVGQLLAPTLVTTLFHWLVLGMIVAYAVYQGIALPVGMVLLAAGAFVSFNFLMYGLENLLFLVFPMRLTQNTPGDLQSVGRHVVQTLTKILALMVVIGLAALLAVWVYYTMGHSEHLALLSAWAVLTLAGLALIPPIMAAFQNYDVGRDTPP